MRSNGTRAGDETTAELIAQLMWSPKTANELVDALGIMRQSLHKKMQRLMRSGVVYIHSYYEAGQVPGCVGIVYAIQKKPFEQPNAERPESWKN